MKSRWTLLVGVALALTTSLALARVSAELSPEQKQALWQQAAVVGPQQERLAALAGTWDVKISLLMDPQHPIVEHGKSTYTLALGGRHLVQNLHFGAEGKEFEGIGYLSYDNVSGKYLSSWMDTTFTGAMLAEGAYDPSTETYTFHGGQSDPTKEVDVTPVREVLHLIDGDHFTYEYFEVHAGKEAMAVRLEYSRIL